MKIAFIAMSGIRVCDTDLLELGLTLPGFVERSKVIASLPSLGLLTLAGMTPDNHEKEYHEVPSLSVGMKSENIPWDIDLAAISSYSAQIDEMYELGDLFRKRGVPVVLGGPHVSRLPDEAGAHGDAVVIGEGEVCWPDVLADTESGHLKKVYDATGKVFDMAQAPMPAYELLDIDQYNRLTVQTSRGCPHRCEFCAGSILISDRYSQKPMEKVLAEIDRICEIWPKPFIEFADDNTFVNAAYWKKLLPQLKDREIRWFTETDISVAYDVELLRLMRESGCAQVLIGLESPTDAALDGLETRSNWKLRQWPHYKEAIKTIQSHGISVNGCFIVGLDHHDRNIFDQITEFVKEAELGEVQITIQTPFPGTPLMERLENENRILEKKAWNKCTLFDVNYQPKNMSVTELEDGFRRLAVDLYSDEFTRHRRECFRRYLRKYLASRKGARAE